MKKVLVIDHTKSMRNTLRERLEYEGFSIVTANNEVDARKLLSTVHFDLLLTDEVPSCAHSEEIPDRKSVV